MVVDATGVVHATGMKNASGAAAHIGGLVARFASASPAMGLHLASECGASDKNWRSSDGGKIRTGLPGIGSKERDCPVFIVTENQPGRQLPPLFESIRIQCHETIRGGKCAQLWQRLTISRG